MARRSPLLWALAGAALVAGVGWYAWTRRSAGLYGGVRPYMEKLQKLHWATGAVVARSGPLPKDLVEMEGLAQTAQDVFAVFTDDPRGKDPRFAPLAAELMRRGSMLEHAWDAGHADQARRAFADLTRACEACHVAFGADKAPKLTPSP